jgi:hypothetical protein
LTRSSGLNAVGIGVAAQPDGRAQKVVDPVLRTGLPIVSGRDLPGSGVGEQVQRELAYRAQSDPMIAPAIKADLIRRLAELSKPPSKADPQAK